VENDKCKSDNFALFVGVCTIIPLWIRVLQCLRNYYDTKLIFPHLFNVLKYLLSIVVVVYGIMKIVDAGYYTIIVLTTVYKWWWDVVIDWGLLDVFPIRGRLFNHILLREDRMYPNPWLYYLGMAVDFLLRYILYIMLLFFSFQS
jgi:xenotropic and polytropic retrovirus receptor 1